MHIIFNVQKWLYCELLNIIDCSFRGVSRIIEGNYMKHVIKIFFVLLLSCCFVVPANALELQSIDAPNINPFGIGILTLDDGTQIEVEDEIVDTASTLNYNSDKSITYKYHLPSVARAGGSSTVHDNDSGYASTVYLTISYDVKGSPSTYLLKQVSGYWLISDPNVSVASAKLNYGCTGTFPIPTTQSVTGVSVSNYFTRNTGFADYISDAYEAVLGANLILTYKMGSSRVWSFTFINNLLNV